MAISPPIWLNSAFFEKALRFDKKDPNLTVISYEVGRATQPGDNFGSEMYRAVLRIKVNGEAEETSLIIKCKLEGGELSQVKQVSDAFIREANILSEIIILMSKEAFLEEFQPVAPKCIYTSREPSYEAIVMEDLKRERFTLAKVSHGLDLKHCLLVMRTIAQFHASASILRQKDPHLFGPFMESHFVKHHNAGMSRLVHTCLKNLVEEVNRWPGYEKYIDTLKELMSTGMNHWIKAIRSDDTEFRVLNHGDLWLNNMMFSYSEESGEVQQVRFVDFQLSCVSSPAVDLQYFMNSSASAEVLENNLHELIEEYYNTLCQILSKLGHENLQPSLNNLKSELHKKGLYGALVSFSVRSVALGDRNHVPDLEEMKKGILYFSDAYKTGIRKMLPLYEKWGWLKI